MTSLRGVIEDCQESIKQGAMCVFWQKEEFWHGYPFWEQKKKLLSKENFSLLNKIKEIDSNAMIVYGTKYTKMCHKEYGFISMIEQAICEKHQKGKGYKNINVFLNSYRKKKSARNPKDKIVKIMLDEMELLAETSNCLAPEDLCLVVDKMLAIAQFLRKQEEMGNGNGQTNFIEKQ